MKKFNLEDFLSPEEIQEIQNEFKREEKRKRSKVNRFFKLSDDQKNELSLEELEEYFYAFSHFKGFIENKYRNTSLAYYNSKDKVTLQSLAKSTTFENIAPYFSSELRSESFYLKKAFHTLQTIEPKENEENLYIFIDEDSVVYGRNVPELERLSLSLTDIESWAGFYIDPALFEKGVKSNSIIACCLSEMTFYGDENDKDELAESLKSMTE